MAARPSRSAARLASILDHLPDALLLVDGSGRIVNGNARAVEAFHAGGATPAAGTPTSLVGLPLVDVLPGFGHGRGPATTSRYDAGRRAAPERMVARGLDGTSFPVDVSWSVVAWAEGDDLLLLVIRLISEAPPAETELYRSQQQTHALLRAAEEAICGVDAGGRVVLANPSASRLLGRRASEAAGKDLHAMALHTRVDGAPYPVDASPLFDTLRTGRTHRRRSEVVWRHDGTPVPVEMSTVAVKEGNEVVGAIATFTDATRVIDLERRRDRLVALLDEEVRSSVTSLHEEVRRLRSDVSPHGVAQLLARTTDAADRLLATLDEAMEHERFMSGATELKRQPADIGKLVEVAVEATAPEAEAGGVIVAVFVEPIVVQVDTPRVIAALTGLLNSAVYASSRGATTAVTTSRRGRYVRVVVRDTEVPPSPDERPHHPLLRGLLPRPGRGERAALDVDFVQAVADRHGGRFIVELGQGGGLVYALELPLPAEDVRPALPSRRTRARHSGPQADERTVRPPAIGPAGAGAARRHAAGAPSGPAAAAPAQQPPPAAATPAATTPATQPASQPATQPASQPATQRLARPTAIPAAQPSPQPSPQRLPSAPPVAAVPPRTAASATPISHHPAPGEGAGQRILVWPPPHEATARALHRRGWSPVPIRQAREVAERAHTQGAALLIDPLTGPVTRRMLVDVRAAAARARLPMLVAAGLGEGAGDAPYASDPAALIGALHPPGAPHSRVLLVADDPPLAAAVGASLERRGMHALVARSESEAMLRAAIVLPDLVLFDLSLTAAPRPGILDWLRAQDRLPETPVVAFAAAGLAPGHERRLGRGQTVLTLQPRPDDPGIDERLAELVLRLAGTPESR